jgi:drug/metabolite transporter (DMT)-like permease
VAALLSKLATRDVSAERGTFWFLFAFVPLAAVILGWDLARGGGPSGWAPAAADWPVLAAIGATYGVGNLTLLAAYRGGGKASIVTPLCALYPVVTIPLAVGLFRERVGPWEAVGIGLALASAVALSAERAGPPADSPEVPH